MGNRILERYFPRLPDGWIEMHIGDALEEVDYPIKMRDSEVYHLVSIRRRSGGMFLRESLPGSKILTKTLREVVPGTFVIARMQVVHGATALATTEFAGCAISKSYSTFTGTRRCTARYFSWLAKLPFMYAYFLDSSQGVVIEKMTFDQERWLSLPIYLPPVSEQRRITEILDTVDKAIRVAEQLIVKADLVRQGVLHDLLSRGIGGARTLRDGAGPGEFVASALGPIPASWSTSLLESLARISSGTTPPREQSRYWAGGTIPWVKTGEVAFTTITGTAEHVTASALRETSLRLLPAETLLVAMYGEGVTRGRCALLGTPATTNQACAALEVNRSHLSPRFLYHYLQSNYDRVRDLGQGSHQTNLSCALLGKLEIVVPPLYEQEAIAATLDGIDNRIQAERDGLAKLTRLRLGLMEALLTGRVRVRARLEGEAA